MARRSAAGPCARVPAVLIRVGSRGSRLALTQAELASARIRAPGIEIALVPITTAGDKDRTKPFGEKGSFLTGFRSFASNVSTRRPSRFDSTGFGNV